MKNRTIKQRCLLLLGTFAVVGATLAYGQGGRASINGTVTDQSGGVIADAEVRIRNTRTEQVTTVATTAEGNYSAPFLPVGSYEISALRVGFSRETRTGITLSADQVATANFILKPGEVTSTIEVEATAVELNATTGAIGQVINEKAVVELPLNGQNPAELVFVAPVAINGTFTGLAVPGSGSGYLQEP